MVVLPCALQAFYLALCNALNILSSFMRGLKMNNNSIEILNFLKDACTKINFFEASAKQSLAENNSQKYQEIMLEKAKFLATMSIKVQPILLLLTENLRNIVEPELQNFSSSALNAISHNSPFYMSALLFPDDYVEGDLNNLEKFTAKIKAIVDQQ